MSKFGNIVQAKAEMFLTKDQLEEAKQEHIDKVLDKWDPEHWSQDGDTIKSKLVELHAYLVRIVTQHYDAEERFAVQEYDLKELNERQRQVRRNEARKTGRDPEEEGGKPPKVPVIAAGERQIDRRNFRERRAVYEKKGAVPHFPNVPTAESAMDKNVNDAEEEDEDDDDYYNY